MTTLLSLCMLYFVLLQRMFKGFGSYTHIVTHSELMNAVIMNIMYINLVCINCLILNIPKSNMDYQNECRLDKNNLISDFVTPIVL